MFGCSSCWNKNGKSKNSGWVRSKQFSNKVIIYCHLANLELFTFNSNLKNIQYKLIIWNSPKIKIFVVIQVRIYRQKFWWYCRRLMISGLTGNNWYLFLSSSKRILYSSEIVNRTYDISEIFSKGITFFILRCDADPD